MDEIFSNEMWEAFTDPYQLGLMAFLSLISTAVLIYFDSPKKEKTNPLQGNGFMKGYKKPDLPPKTIQELLALEDKDESLPMISLEELQKHDGMKGSKPWVALKGVVYDVSANEVYDSKGGYNVFSGQDASYSLATMLFDKLGDRNWRKCKKDELECLDEWVYYYKDRYKKVGYLIDEYEKTKSIT